MTPTSSRFVALVTLCAFLAVPVAARAIKVETWQDTRAMSDDQVRVNELQLWLYFWIPALIALQSVQMECYASLDRGSEANSRAVANAKLRYVLWLLVVDDLAQTFNQTRVASGRLRTNSSGYILWSLPQVAVLAAALSGGLFGLEVYGLNKKFFNVAVLSCALVFLAGSQADGMAELDRSLARGQPDFEAYILELTGRIERGDEADFSRWLE